MDQDTEKRVFEFTIRSLNLIDDAICEPNDPEAPTAVALWHRMLTVFARSSYPEVTYRNSLSQTADNWLYIIIKNELGFILFNTNKLDLILGDYYGPTSAVTLPQVMVEQSLPVPSVSVPATTIGIAHRYRYIQPSVNNVEQLPPLEQVLRQGAVVFAGETAGASLVSPETAMVRGQQAIQQLFSETQSEESALDTVMQYIIQQNEVIKCLLPTLNF